MWQSYSSRLAEVDSALAEILHDVCYRCRLRLAAIKDSRQYHCSKGASTDPPEAKKVKVDNVPCLACLGVLQDQFMSDALQSVSFSEIFLYNCDLMHSLYIHVIGV